MSTRQGLAGRALRLGEGRREVGAGTHHLARGAHLGTEQRVGAGEACKRQHGLLDADHARRCLIDVEVLDALAERHTHRGIDERNTRGLGDERHRAARARVGLEHVDLAVADGVLDVDEADHAEGASELDRLAPDLGLDGRADRQRRDHAGRVARMNAGLLDVLHDRTDQDIAAIGDGIDVDLDRVLNKAVDQRGRTDVAVAQGGLVVTDAHRAATEHVRRAHEYRIADAVGDLDRLLHAIGDRPVGSLQTRAVEQLAEAQAILGEVDALERGAEDRHALLQQALRQPQRRLAAELHHHADRVLACDHLEHVLDRERLEVQTIRRVVVGADGLGVAVDHHRRVAEATQRHRRMHAAVVKLEALADPVGARAEDDHARAIVLDLLVHRVVTRVAIGAPRLDLGSARVDALEARDDAEAATMIAQRLLVGADDVCELGVAETHLLGTAHRLGVKTIEAECLNGLLLRDHARKLLEKPRVDLAFGAQRQRIFAGAQTAEDQVVPVPLGDLEAALGARRGIELAAAQPLAEALGERAADRHRLADRLHLRGERVLGARELLEREARQLRHDVVERRLEAGRRRLREVVWDLVERVANRELGRDLGDRIARRLRRERRRAAHARVHLDHDNLARVAIEGELHIRAAGLHADRADHHRRRIAQRLELAVGQGHGGRDADGVARVHAHRVEVLDGTDDHDVVVLVADHLQLELAPALDRLLDQYLADRARAAALADEVTQLVEVGREAAALTAERKRRADHHRQPQRAIGDQLLGLLHARDRLALRGAQADPRHGLREQLAVLGRADRVDRRADQLDTKLVEHARRLQIQRGVERRLATQRGQQRVGALGAQHAGYALHVERLDVRAIGPTRVGHDRRRIRVDQDGLVALLAQHAQGLHARVVELAGLPDHDRAGADDRDLLEVVSARH